MSKRVCLISTVNHNVGDDFVREGIIRLLGMVLGPLQPVVVHKHFPATAGGPLAQAVDRMTRWTQRRPAFRAALNRMLDRKPADPATDAVLASDILVQCGAPVYWKNRFSSCSSTEWYGPLVEQRWRRVRERVPLLNLGAGSCQALPSDGSEIWEDQACRQFIHEFSKEAALTTVRDCLAQQIVRQCGHDAPLLPCPSIFAPEAAGIVAHDSGYVALNYMPAGGHYDISDARGARDRWEGRFREAALDLARRHPLLLICHDRKEEAQAARLLPNVSRTRVIHWRHALEAYAGCRFALVNRVHGAMAAAALGKPVVLVGNDTRLYTGKVVPGLRALPVTAGRDEFEAALQEAETGKTCDAGAFLAKAEKDYVELLKSALQAK
jgi:hypothetical protein